MALNDFGVKGPAPIDSIDINDKMNGFEVAMGVFIFDVIKTTQKQCENILETYLSDASNRNIYLYILVLNCLSGYLSDYVSEYRIIVIAVKI